MPERIAVFGGVYSNFLALDAALRDARRRGVEAVYCLGDLGAFGPHPDRVFPLLCPVREYDWIDGWTCTLIYSESGHAEHGCTFETEMPGIGRATWTVTEYDPEGRRIRFAVFVPEMFVETLEVELVEVEGGTTEVRWRRSYTGLNPRGQRGDRAARGRHRPDRPDGPRIPDHAAERRAGGRPDDA